jgi:uncharacterized membrane protein YeaQ/YmgE (transglycosylase-associated protein family)
MKEKTLLSNFTLLGTLACYYYAKTHQKDIVPYSMIGGFVGAWVGEIIAQVSTKKSNHKRSSHGNNNHRQWRKY